MKSSVCDTEFKSNISIVVVDCVGNVFVCFFLTIKCFGVILKM